MFAHWHNTMSNARQIVEDRGFAPPRRLRRDRIAALSRRYQHERAMREARNRARMEALERWIEGERERKEAERARRVTDHLSAVAESEVLASRAPAIIKQVAAWHCVDPTDVFSASRRAPHVAARFDATAAVYLNCSQGYVKLSIQKLSRIFGKDHSTILNALKQRGLK